MKIYPSISVPALTLLLYFILGAFFLGPVIKEELATNDAMRFLARTSYPEQIFLAYQQTIPNNAIEEATAETNNVYSLEEIATKVITFLPPF